MDRVAQATDVLEEMRHLRRTVVALPAEVVPRTLGEAYQVQDQVVGRRLAQTSGRPIGYKVAATNPMAQKLLGVTSPFFGILLSGSTYPTPAALPANEFSVRCVEAEFAFEIAADVTPADTPYTPATIRAFVAAALPAIEVVEHRFQDWTTVGALSLVADNAIHGAWIEGKTFAGWRDVDFPRHAVVVSVNGRATHTGTGANVLGDPLAAVAWLADELPKYGRQLRRGDKVTTGAAAPVYLAAPGDRVAADFGSMGSVEVSFTG